MTPNDEERHRERIRQWEAAGQELERMRRKNLRGKPYDWKEVDALLELGDLYDGPPRQTSGLVEMQYWFRRAAQQLDTSDSDQSTRSDRE